MEAGERSSQPVTPEKPKAAVEDHTPFKDKLGMEQWEKQTYAHKRIREQMRDEILECSVDTFLTHYSPFPPNNALVQAAKQVLIREQLLILNEQGEPKEWLHFPNGWSRDGTEQVVFKPLETIANVFDNSLQGLNGRERHFFYRDCHYTVVKSEIPGSNFKLDASFVGNLNHAKNYYMTCSEIAVVTEFKKIALDFLDNRQELVSAASHIMNDDPCRKWMYGITIENNEMAVWYFSRSHSVKSEAFHFTKDIDTFIRVFLSFIYATRKEMGYDPTVHRIDDDGLRYVYEIPHATNTRYFKTIELLSHRRVLCITGRKTRVWRAVEVKGLGDETKEEMNDGKEVALKDVWLDEGSRTEQQNLDEIFKCLGVVEENVYRWASPMLQTKLKAAFEEEGYKKYFMEIECDSFGFGESKGTSDHATPAPEILESTGQGHNDDSDQGTALEDENMLAGSTQTAGYSSMPQNDYDMAYLKTPLAMKVRSYKVKQQYRLVYKEVGESLDLVETLRTSVSAVMDTYIALVLMNLAGWVHRDISAGNIIVVGQPGGKPRAKLSDLEYAKHCADESSSSDPKTGTPFFMPLELHSGMPLPDPEPEPSTTSDSGSDDDVDPDDDEWPTNQNLFAEASPQSLRPAPLLKYRPLHGFESLWWVLMYILIYRVDYEGGKVLSKMIFAHTPVPTLARQQLFQHVDQVSRVLEKYMHRKLQLSKIIGNLNAIPRAIRNSYRLKKPVTPETMGEVYNRLYRHFGKVVLAVKTVKGVSLRPIQRAQPSKKRSRNETLRKPRDSADYEEEERDEEPSSEIEMPQSKKRSNANATVDG